MTVAPHSIPIIVLAGQSNANSIGIGQSVFAEAAAEHGLYIHAAVNGTPISPLLDHGDGDWSASGVPGSGELLTSLMDQIAAMLDPNSPSYVPGAYLEKVVWVQGEADAWLARAAASYETELKALHAAMTARFGAHDLVISALSDTAITGTATTDAHRANWAVIQAAQIDLAAQDPTVQLVDPDTVAQKGGFGLWQMLNADHLHYNTASGYASALGRALAAASSTHQALDSPGGTGTNAPHYAIGTEGNDTMTLSASGIGQAYGSGGTDTLTLTDRTDGVEVFRAGMDALRVVANGGAAFLLDLVSIESLILTPGADTVIMADGLARVDAAGGNDHVNGLTGNDTILLGAGNDLGGGGGGNDTIYGGDGFDWMYGGLGNDLMSGDAANDRLYGGDGNDRIIGGTGNDLLSGGTGADVFVFDAASGVDHISDFQNGADRIEFHSLTAAALQISSSGTETIIHYSTCTLILDGIAASLITAADFTFT